jgi:hypothetical protein
MALEENDIAEQEEEDGADTGMPSARWVSRDRRRD